MNSTAPRCAGSNTTQWDDEWAGAATHLCHLCNHVVKYRVRESDRPRWGRVLPHRTDGTPCR